MSSPSLDLHTSPTSPACPTLPWSSPFPTRPLLTISRVRGVWKVKSRNSSSLPLLLDARNRLPKAPITSSPTSPTPLPMISQYHYKSKISPRRNGQSIAMHRLITRHTSVYLLLHVPTNLIHSSIAELGTTTSIKTLPLI